MAHRLHRMELRMVAHFEASRLEVHPKEMNKRVSYYQLLWENLKFFIIACFDQKCF